MGDIYFFVVYESRNKSDGSIVIIHNEVLHNIHPVLWLAQPPDAYNEHFTSRLLFFAEIPASVAENPLVKAHYTFVHA